MGALCGGRLLCQSWVCELLCIGANGVMASTLATFGASVSGSSLESSSAARVTQRPVVVSVEAGARRNLKKEKQQRNRQRVNELKRLGAKNLQKTFYRREEDTAKLPDDYLSPFSYDSRGEPVTKEVEEEPMLRFGRTWIN